jgi:hypothetical protein
MVRRHRESRALCKNGPNARGPNAPLFSVFSAIKSGLVFYGRTKAWEKPSKFKSEICLEGVPRARSEAKKPRLGWLLPELVMEVESIVLGDGEVAVEESLCDARDELDEFILVNLAGILADDLQLRERKQLLDDERREQVTILIGRGDDSEAATE